METTNQAMTWHMPKKNLVMELVIIYHYPFQ